jgi:hypothetical protein
MCRIGGPGGDAPSGDRIKAQICVMELRRAAANIHAADRLPVGRGGSRTLHRRLQNSVRGRQSAACVRGERIGFDTSTRMAMNAVFAPDRKQADARKPQPFSDLGQGDDPKSTGAPDLKPFRIKFFGAANHGPPIVPEVEIQALDASAAIVASANVTLPPRTFGVTHPRQRRPRGL